jgi:hypothetical protein
MRTAACPVESQSMFNQALKVVFLLLSSVSAVAFADTRDAVLFIGDSHTVGSFGRILDGMLRSNSGGTRVETYGSCGSSPIWWFNGYPTSCGYFFRDSTGFIRRGKSARIPSLTGLLDRVKPGVVVVELGANLIKSSDEHSRVTLRRMVGKIAESGARCVWVGPPNGRNKPEKRLAHFYQLLREEVEPVCDLIDSREFTHYPAKGGDGAHFDSLGPKGVAIARGWAEAVFEILVDRAGIEPATR